MNNKCFALNESKFLYTKIDEEGVLFDLDANEYLRLNSTLNSIFNYLKEDLSLTEIKNKLMIEFSVSEKECEEGIAEGIQLLLSKGWINEKDCV